MKNQVVPPQTQNPQHFKTLPLNFSIQAAKEIKRFYNRNHNNQA